MTLSFYSKQNTLVLLTSAFLFHASLFSNDSCAGKDKQDCVNANRFTLRHIESKGIGYKQGYTTLEAFFIPLHPLRGRWIPFLDGRAHIFNNGRPAANIGAGLRYLNSRLWGANIYYDFRQTSKLNYNQVSCGLETIGEKIDARINGYFPVGKHTSTRGSATFDYFKGHHLYLIKKEEFALQGVNAELGLHLGRSKAMNFYTAFGPYYFLNNSKQAIGGSFRISMDIRDAFKIEANTSYDNLYRWIGQGQVSIAYAFKPKKFDRLRGHKKTSSPSFDIRSRILQKVDKFEIVVVDTKKHKSMAINPATGEPYFFLFLDPKQPDNGLGTFESPLNSLDYVTDLVPLNLESPESLLSSEIQKTPEVTTPVTSKVEAMIAAPAQAQPPVTPKAPVLPPVTPKAEEVIAAPAQLQPPFMPKVEEIIMIPSQPSIAPKVKEITLVPGRGQELQTTLGTVMVPASQKGRPKITHVKDIEHQGKKTHVFVITMEDDEENQDDGLTVSLSH